MPHVSRNKLSKITEQMLVEKLSSVFTHIGKGEDMLGFLDALLTPTEKVMLAKRLAIIVLLEEGLPESRIASMLHVTRITVSRMQLYYEARGHGFKIALQKLEQEKQLGDFKQYLLSLAKYSVRAAGGRL